MNRKLKFNLAGLILGIVLWIILSIWVKLMQCGGVECVYFPESYFFTFLLPLAFIVGIIILNLIAIEQSSKRIFNIKIFPLIIFCSYLLTKILMMLYNVSYRLFMNIRGFQSDIFIEFFDSIGPFLFISSFIIFLLWFSKKMVLDIKSVLKDTLLILCMEFFIIFILTSIFNKFLFSYSFALLGYGYVDNVYRSLLPVNASRLKLISVLGGLVTLIIWIILQKKTLPKR